MLERAEQLERLERREGVRQEQTEGDTRTRFGMSEIYTLLDQAGQHTRSNLAT